LSYWQLAGRLVGLLSKAAPGLWLASRWSSSPPINQRTLRMPRSGPTTSRPRRLTAQRRVIPPPPLNAEGNESNQAGATRVRPRTPRRRSPRRSVCPSRWPTGIHAGRKHAKQSSARPSPAGRWSRFETLVSAKTAPSAVPAGGTAITRTNIETGLWQQGSGWITRFVRSPGHYLWRRHRHAVPIAARPESVLNRGVLWRYVFFLPGRGGGMGIRLIAITGGKGSNGCL
jgi:hypothetical protein